MNFNFADINSTLLDRVQNDLFRERRFDTGADGPEKSLFSKRLSKTLEIVGPLKGGGPLNYDPMAGNAARRMERVVEKLNEKKGAGFVSELKNIFLMLSKGDLKTVSIDAEGLAVLKKMLLTAGFKENDIDELMADVSEELEKNSLEMDALFDKLFDLSFEADLKKEKGQENFLETSAMPFFESILNSLGLPKEKIQEIFIEADKGDKGISLDILIEKFQALQKTSFYTQHQFKTQESDGNIRHLLGPIGIEVDRIETSGLTRNKFVGPLEKLGQTIPETSGLTFNEFVGSLENFRRKLSQEHRLADVPGDKNQKAPGGETALTLIKDLFKGLEFKTETIDKKTTGFSYSQIKDQFKNELILPVANKLFLKEGEESGTKGTFPFSKETLSSAGTKQTRAFKEMEAFLDGKKQDFQGVKEQAIENKGFLKQLKAGNAKRSDQLQFSTSGVKPNQAESGLDTLKSKASFKNLPAYVTHQVSKSLVRAFNQGENILKIQLKPPELGRLVMTIDNTGNNMKVSIMTETSAAREILISNANDLRTVLSASGVTLERFDVDMNSAFKHSMADAGNQTGNFGKRHRGRIKSLSGTDNGEGIMDAIRHSEALNQSGSLHFVA